MSVTFPILNYNILPREDFTAVEALPALAFKNITSIAPIADLKITLPNPTPQPASARTPSHKPRKPHKPVLKPITKPQAPTLAPYTTNIFDITKLLAPKTTPISFVPMQTAAISTAAIAPKSALDSILHWGKELICGTGQKAPTISLAGILQHLPGRRFVALRALGTAMFGVNADLRVNFLSYQNKDLFKKKEGAEYFAPDIHEARAGIELNLPAICMPILAALAKGYVLGVTPFTRNEATESGIANQKTANTADCVSNILGLATVAAPVLNTPLPFGPKTIKPDGYKEFEKARYSTVRIKLTNSWTAIWRGITGQEPINGDLQLEISGDRDLTRNGRIRTSFTNSVFIKLNDPSQAVFAAGIKGYLDVAKRWSWLQDAEVNAKLRYTRYDIQAGTWHNHIQHEVKELAPNAPVAFKL